MQERKEESIHNGDKLAELYLKMTKDAKRKRDEGASPSSSQVLSPSGLNPL